MAGLGRKVFNAGEVLSAANVQGYLQDQVVQVYSGTAARSSALGTAVSEGMTSYLTDSNELSVYTSNGTAVWSPVNLSQSPNALINGAFEINQRAFTSITTSGHGYDRWYTYMSNGTVTASAQPFTAGTAPIAGFEGVGFYRNVTSGQTATSAASNMSQAIESVRTFAGQTVTISFYAKAGSGTPKIAAEFQQQFGSGGSVSTSVGTYAGQVTLSTSWARYSMTVAVPSIAGKTLGTSHDGALALVLWFSAGTDFNSRTGSLGIQSNTFDVWGVQVEAGAVATPFKRNANSLQGELSACQRYCQLVGSAGIGMWWSSTTCQITWPLPTWMRAAPSATLRTTSPVIGDAGVANRTGSGSTLGIDVATTSGLTANITGFSSATNGRVAQVKTDGMVLLEAEL